ncbi:MAG: metal-dependent transcriptional regulator [candidate division Zixibacteria bacterium]|nr:metal-dependent transcriptional regulator [Candidatus Tariuqbacter arcticus]
MANIKHESIKERHEDLMEVIGVHLEKGENNISDLQRHDITRPRLQEIVDTNHIIIDEKDRVQFLPKGEREFLSLIRRHRLAERLFHDVLDISDEEGSEEMVCKVEHILTEDVTDSICTLLGHPTICPHGKPIPPGRCCELKDDQVKPLVVPLSRIEIGSEGTIAFMSTNDRTMMERLAAMGLIPGIKLKLQQLKPAVVILFEETVLSLDTEFADAVYIRRKMD